MTKQLLILAGGLGTRLKARLGDLPKPMIPIGGKPLLEIQIELARRHGFTDILIFACYRADLIEAHFGDGSRWGARIRYVIEQEPLGTAGAVLAGLSQLAENFVVMYGDTMINVDLDRFWQAHLAAAADATLLLHPNDHPLDSDLVEVDDHERVTAFHNRPHAEGKWFQNLVNAGLYVIRREALEPSKAGRGVLTAPHGSDPTGDALRTARPAAMDFGKDLFPAMLRRGAQLLGYNSPEYIKDIGTPQRYDKICAEFASGLVARSSFDTSQPTVFLDRDGTLVAEVSNQGLHLPEQLELLPGTAEAIALLNHTGYRVVVVTNQPVVAKGLCTEAELRVIHNKMETLLGREHAFVDRIYHCPHHPDRGFAGERPELKTDCECRKPKPGLVLQAARELNLDLKRSWLVGDTTRDVETARRAGVRAVLVRTGHGGRDGKCDATPDFVFDTLLDAARFIVKQQW